ncbi:hypothetical protein [Thalassococcus sp. S3]|uniref:hypothetical protein n=1 Tax=Thalassococcus sp. S3 TaxID=2017482 RepID=UPI00102408CA|nr:hypothetical protein [Thalassococcus sp. S3]QBF31777.1 hypothetical protein CFI11_11165 [Thalassococcus sp. S3]
MTNVQSSLQLVCRCVVAVVLLIPAMEGMRGNGPKVLDAFLWSLAPAADIAAYGLMIAISVWIAFGLYTRIMTAVGGCLFAACFVFIGGHVPLSGLPEYSLVLFVMASVPLLIYGGGAYSILERRLSAPSEA